MKTPSKIRDGHAGLCQASLKHEIEKLSPPFAVLRFFKSSLNKGSSSRTNSRTKPNTIDDSKANTNNTSWSPEVEKALLKATNAPCHLVASNAAHVAVVITGSSIDKTNQLTRIVRNHLMRVDQSSRFSIAAAQIDNDNLSIEDLLLEMDTDLSGNIEQESSRIQVKHYKA